jgi:hypothetical protein
MLFVKSPLNHLDSIAAMVISYFILSLAARAMTDVGTSIGSSRGSTTLGLISSTVLAMKTPCGSFVATYSQDRSVSSFGVRSVTIRFTILNISPRTLFPGYDL